MPYYTVTPEDLKNIEDVFTFHPVQLDQPDRYAHLRTEAKDLARHILAMCPPSRERSLAITNLQQAIMWANASIAINEEPVTP